MYFSNPPLFPFHPKFIRADQVFELGGGYHLDTRFFLPLFFIARPLTYPRPRSSPGVIYFPARTFPCPHSLFLRYVLSLTLDAPTAAHFFLAAVQTRLRVSIIDYSEPKLFSGIFWSLSTPWNRFFFLFSRSSTFLVPYVSAWNGVSPVTCFISVFRLHWYSLLFPFSLATLFLS